VPVVLYFRGEPIRTLLTDANGGYLFEQLVPGDYYVVAQMTNISPAVIVSPSFAGADREIDSDFTLHQSGSGESLVRYADSPPVSYADGESDLFIDLGLSLLSSTRAEVAEVWGEWAGGEGRVAWRTSSEWGTAGFFLYRVDPETGEEVRLNDVLTPSAFHDTSAVYELADPAAAEGISGTYRLEEVELSGAVLDHGRHEVVFGPPPPAAQAARSEARAAKRATASVPAKQAVPKLAGPSGVLKATYRREGFYAVALPAIAHGMGLDLGEVRALAAGNFIALDGPEGPVAAIHDAERDRLVFHGRPANNWYARDAAVRISVGEGAPMPRREPGATTGEAILPTNVRFEEDRYAIDSLSVRPADLYYWDFIISGATNGTGVRDFPLDLAGLAGGDVALNVRLQGWSSTANHPDHRAEFFFNGQPVGSATFDGQEAVEAEVVVSAAQVVDGVNVLSVKGVLQPGHTHSTFVVDWIDASFARELGPLAATAHFRAGGAHAISAAAYEQPLAVALDEAGNPTWIADVDGRLSAKAWVVVASSEERFAVIEAEGIPAIEPDPVNPDPWFLAETNRIDYLVVVSRELEAAAQELADYRAGQGLRVGVATFEDLCDWMAGGLRTPEAIPALLAHAAQNWAEAPWMVVLAGNGHYDYLGAFSAEPNHVPPMLALSHNGLFSADGLLADIDGDALADLAIGRLPALTAADLSAMIAKIKAYEQGFGEAWQGQLVLATDKSDAKAGDFMTANTRIAALARDGGTITQRIDLDTMPIAAARLALTNWYRNGVGIVHYTGHGGATTVGSLGTKLLNATDVTRMANPTRPPVTVALSCLVGRYEAPGVNSLGELLMRKAGGGSVAVWGPSGLSRNDPAAELGEAFYRTVPRADFDFL
jgi:hypothetical protein